MTDWKKKIDAEEAAQNLDRRRKEIELQQKQEEHNQKIWNSKLNDLGRKFRCHIAQCGKLPTTPYIEEKETSADWYRVKHIEHWDIPGDLWKCVSCSKWTCKEHLYKGICQECAEKM